MEQKKFEKKLVSTLTLSGGPASNKNIKGRIELIYVNLIGRIEFIYVISIIIKSVWKFII